MVVIIAILAAITIVAYNAIQDRANESKMKTAVRQVEKAMRIWSLDYGDIFVSGISSSSAVANGRCANGNGGFFGTATYTCTAEDALVSATLLPAGFSSKLPANKWYNTASGGRLSIMLYQCGAGKSAIYWTLRNPTAEDTTSINDTLTTCGNSVSIRDNWGMKAAVIIDMR